MQKAGRKTSLNKVHNIQYSLKLEIFRRKVQPNQKTYASNNPHSEGGWRDSINAHNISHNVGTLIGFIANSLT